MIDIFFCLAICNLFDKNANNKIRLLEKNSSEEEEKFDVTLR